jgi:5-methyltetrahydropteroyltriglutamate--homocysteine methyltransferase
MSIPTEPIGSIPRPPALIEATQAAAAGRISAEELDGPYAQAVQHTIAAFKATGSPVVTDGEQRKPSFATYPLNGVTDLAPDGVVIPFADGHMRQLPHLTAGPFRYGTYSDTYLRDAQRHTSRPLKQTVISASALSLLYPQEGIDGYPRESFLADLMNEAETDIRRSLDAGAHVVQIDFTEARLSLKLDPSGGLLRDFVELNNGILGRSSADERQRLASEPDRRRVLGIVAENLGPEQRVCVGVTDPIDPRIESPEEVRDRVLEAAEVIPPAQLGTTDDCGFSPFGDDTSTARETAFEKVRSRVQGTKLAERELGA